MRQSTKFLTEPFIKSSESSCGVGTLFGPILEQRFSVSSDFALPGTSDASDGHGWQQRGGCCWHLVGRGPDAPKHLTMHRASPTTKTIRSHRSTVTRFEKSCYREGN